jgi:hypothetical protein
LREKKVRLWEWKGGVYKGEAGALGETYRRLPKPSTPSARQPKVKVSSRELARQEGVMIESITEAFDLTDGIYTSGVD